MVVFDEYVRRGRGGSSKLWEMDFESFLDFVLVLENREIFEGFIYLFKCFDLYYKGFFIIVDVYMFFR